MKLLSPQELRDTKAQDTSREILRTKEINKAAEVARKNLANAEADFARALAGQSARWAREEQDHNKDVAERQAELKILEARRQKALEPIEELKKETQDTLLEAQNALQDALRREDEAQDVWERLQTALDNVGAREVDVSKREQSVLFHEQNIAIQQKVADANSAHIKSAIQEVKKYREDTEKELDRLRTALTLQEHSLNARSEKLQRVEKKLSDWETRLKDERDTLERAFARIRTPKKGKKV